MTFTKSVSKTYSVLFVYHFFSSSVGVISLWQLAGAAVKRLHFSRSEVFGAHSVLLRQKALLKGKVKEASLVEGFHSTSRGFGDKLYVLSSSLHAVRPTQVFLCCPSAWSKPLTSERFPV